MPTSDGSKLGALMGSRLRAPGGAAGAVAGAEQGRRKELEDFFEYVKRLQTEANQYDLRSAYSPSTGGKVGAYAEAQRRRKHEQGLAALAGRLR